jgi:type IV secretory pathway VirB10-like protein
VTSDDLLGEAVSELYGADPEEFTRRRGELAAAARSAGQAGVARQIAGLRKPTRSAWMINRLVRADPDAVARLATVGEELRAAEHAGDGARLRESSQARRELIATLVPQALAAAGEHNPPAAVREEITATFSAALADPVVAEQIQHATLLRPARRVGFGTAAAPELALVPPPPDARPAARPAGKPAAAGPRRGRHQARTERERRRAEAEAEAERRRAEAEAERERRRAEAEAERERRRARAEAERDLAGANRAAQAARQAEQQQQDTLGRLEQQLADARRLLRDASAQARRAEAARQRAQRALGRLSD